MKIKLTLLTLLLTIAVGAWADDIGEEQAQQLAAQFLTMTPASGAKHTKQARAIVNRQLRIAYKAPSKVDASRTDLYVFNRGEADGFVIVAGNDAATPVVGYCDHGSFDYDSAPDALKALLEKYSVEIDYLREHPEAAVKAPVSTSSMFGNIIVEPLLKTTWSQEAPYWNLCPRIGGVGQTVTGCVATALAQIMNYWKYPQHGRGERSYSWNPTMYTDYDYHVDMSNSVYDWDNMLDSYDNGYTDAQAQAVALLMKDVGGSMCMVYGNGRMDMGSVPKYGVNAWANVFDYDLESMHSVGVNIDTLFWDDHTTRDSMLMDDGIKQDLDAKLPVYLSVGYLFHAVVADGYTDAGFFHINFGWGGMADGYYKTLIIDYEHANPQDRKMARNIEMSAVLGIRPAHSFHRDHFSYTLKDDEAVLNYIDKKGDVEVPSTVTDDAGKTYQVTKIGNSAVMLNEGITSIKLPETIHEIRDNAFMACPDLAAMTGLGKIQRIGESAFADCKNLQSISPLESVEYIGPWAFYWCEQLKIINFPESLVLKEIGNQAFYRCGGPTNSIFLGDVKVGKEAFYQSGLTDVTIGNEMKRVPPHIFYNARNLQKISLGWEVEEIADSAFMALDNLQTVNFNTYSGNSVQTIGKYAFARCEKLANINLEKVQKIGDYAFERCALKQITVNELREAGDHTFPAAETVNIGSRVSTLNWLPQTVNTLVLDSENPYFVNIDNIVYDRDMTTLYYAAQNHIYYYQRHNTRNGETYDTEQVFSTATERTELTIPESVRRIMPAAIKFREGYKGEPYLKQVTLPASLTDLGDSISFPEVFSYAPVPQVNNCHTARYERKLHVPAGCKEAYETADGWKYYTTITDDLPAPVATGKDEYDEDEDAEEHKVNCVRIITTKPTQDYSHRWDGNSMLYFEILMGDNPRIDYKGGEAVISASKDLEVVVQYDTELHKEYALPFFNNFEDVNANRGIYRIIFSYVPEVDAVEELGNDSPSAVRFRMNGRRIEVSGLKAGDGVGLYTIDGQTMDTATASDRGRATLGIPGAMPGAIYVLKAGDASFKIRVKQ